MDIHLQTSMTCLRMWTSQASDFHQNWAEHCSIAGVVGIIGMKRREEFGEVEKWMCWPRFIGRCNKRMQFVFKFQTRLSVTDLEEKQQKHCEKHNLGLTTKLTNPFCMKNIGCVSGPNIKMSFEKWCQKHVTKKGQET